MGRGMEVLGALGRATRTLPRGMSVTEIAEIAGRDRSQVSRSLGALSDSGFAERDALGYRLAPEVAATAQALTAHRLRTDGVSVLEALSEAVGTPCFLGQLAGDSTVTIAESVPASSGLVASWIGRAYPAFCSDAGQAALWDADDAEIRAVLAASDFTTGGPRAVRDADEFIARLNEARDRGYSIVIEEAEPGLASVAAPVFDARGETVAALQLVGPVRELGPRIPELGERCRASAEVLSAALRGERGEVLGS